jgi:hypothetical protein
MLSLSNKFIRGSNKLAMQSGLFSNINISFSSLTRLTSNRLTTSRCLISNIHTTTVLSSSNEEDEKINDERESSFLLFPYRSTPSLNNNNDFQSRLKETIKYIILSDFLMLGNLGKESNVGYLDVDFVIGI